MTQYTVTSWNGQKYGPSDLETLRGWIRQGLILADFEVVQSDGTRSKAGALPELADLFLTAPTPPPLRADSTPRNTVRLADMTARINTSKALAEGWKCFSGRPGLAIGSLFLMWLLMIPSVLPFGIGFVYSTLFMSAVMIGYWKLSLNLVDGSHACAGDILYGFKNRINNSILASVIRFAISLILVIPLVVVAVILVVAIIAIEGSNTSPEDISLGWWALVGLVIVLFATVYVIVMTFLLYLEALLADGAVPDAFGATKSTCRMVFKNIKPLAWYFTVVSLLMILAVITLLGWIIIMPWCMLATAHTYRQLVPRDTLLTP
ncbi:MAG: hypothetical protein SFY92_04655 [Verrucomicrobiae bacterium]|nr:hypothetical protein [Verrucomicrobiae bacterium]